ncbi:MAG: AmmeMemoRadiSam system protein A [Phycisphaerales bacterium]|nr:AmmeMemoRadiSam system protein A [Phycisphaerales bacterium]
MNELPAEVCEQLLELARREVRGALGVMDAAGVCVGHVGPVYDVLRRPAGCFVSLHTLRTGALRGCVGKMTADRPLVDTVGSMARSVLADPRFMDHPITADELPGLVIEISILGPLRSIDGPEAFDLFNEGIYMTLDQRRGCFLPQVARETGWNRQQLLSRLCSEKLGLPADAWQDPHARFEAFSVILIGPKPF